jgi:tRNA (guanine26-N2/guanine27-N2)-dimethyltransferase
LDLARYREGRTVLVVPRASVTEVPPPTAPVFFNPAASLNRDVSVAVAAAAGCETFCDSMAGVGARGVRVANEVGRAAEVVMVDFNRDSLKLARRSASLNRVRGKCAFAESETSAYLSSRFGRDQRFDCIDLDPFGTPIRQIQAALSATARGGILSVTATDTAVLCGVHQHTCVRRYGSVPINNHFHHETGLRILLASLARNAASMDIGIEPVVAHSTRHYLRVFVRVNPGAAKADSSLRELGHVAWCPACGEVLSSRGAQGLCPACGKKLKVAGPLWGGSIALEPLVDAARKEALERGLLGAAEVLGSLAGVNGFPPWSYDIDEICSELKVPTTSELAVYTRLIKGGRRVMRTPFEKSGVKTDAGPREVADAVRAASAEARQELRASGLRSNSRARS